VEDSFQVNDNFSPETEVEDSFNDNNLETGPGDQTDVDVEVDDVTL
jgi:hypothetical protein